MPVFDYAYRTYRGRRRTPIARVFAIPKFTWLDMSGRRLFIWLLTLAWVQFILRVAYIYVLVNAELLVTLKVPSSVLPPIDAKFFKTLIDVQAFFCFAFAFLLGAGLISRDMRHNAIVLLYSKPINIIEYFIGKFLAIFLLLMSITWLQAAILYYLQCLVAPEYSDWRLYADAHAAYPRAIFLYSSALSAMISLLIMAASSLTANPRYAGAAFIMYLIGATICTGIVSGVLGDPKWLMLSPFHAMYQFGVHVFKVKTPQFDVTFASSVKGLGFTAALCGVILWRRLRKAARLAH